MAASFPTSVKSFTTHAVGDLVTAAESNAYHDEIVAVETYLLAMQGGSFTLDAAATTDVSDTNVTASSKILLSPTNAAAATLMSGAKSLYISALTASTSFTVATADGNSAAGTETFDYILVG